MTDPIGQRAARIRWELGVPEYLRQRAAQRDARVRDLAAQFTDWAARNDIRPAGMRYGRRGRFPGWDIGETDRSDLTFVRTGANVIREPPEFTWHLWVSPGKDLMVVLTDHRAPARHACTEADRPVSEFPLEAVEEGIARIVVRTGRPWP